MLNPFYSPITFSITGEDYQVVEQALHVLPKASILCIGSAGDTPLNLLRLNPQRVDSVDISFPQICIATLKAEAMRWLSLSEFHVFVGIERNPEQALEYYTCIRPHLATNIKDFWDSHLHIIKRGLLWQGGVQRMLTLLSKMLFVWLGREGIDALKQLSTREQAEIFYQQYVYNWRFRVFSILTINRLTYRLFYPKFGFRYLPPGMSPHQFSLLKIRDVLLSRPIANNPYLYPFIFSNYPPSPDSYPPYLNLTDYGTIRKRIDCLHFTNSDLCKHLNTTTENSIDCFALCNVMDWMNVNDLNDLLRQVVRVARNGARILIFSRSTTLKIPPSLQTNLSLDVELGERLNVIDRIGYYKSTNVLQIVK